MLILKLKQMIEMQKEAYQELHEALDEFQKINNYNLLNQTKLYYTYMIRL